MVKILILTNKEDSHASRVSNRLKKRGASPIRWFPDEFLIDQKSRQRISKNKFTMMINTKNSIDLIDVDVVWFRRSNFPILPIQLDPFDHEFVEIENRLHMKSFWLTLGESAKWINPFSSFDRSNCKALQLREATRLEMLIPETLITNDKEAVIDFIEENGKNNTIYKTFSPPFWQEGEKSFNFYTTAITKKVLPNESILKLTPGIYQKKIKKNFEVRVTFFDEEYVAVKIHNSEVLDWRILSATPELKLSSIRLPLEIEKKCILLMKKLGIIFGCFDFIVTDNEEYIFLEVNEMGQFLWIEEMLPELKLLDKFCDFLLAP